MQLLGIALAEFHVGNPLREMGCAFDKEWR
jgi:hypothetical protein